MDATVAGLVGALGGAVLGAAGAWGAALIAFRAARYQADRQAEAQQQQWLRQIRRDTYKAFFETISACNTYIYIAAAFRSASTSAGEVAQKQAHRDAATKAIANFEAARAALNLEAPEEIRKKAKELSELFSCLTNYKAWHIPELDDLKSTMITDMARSGQILKLTEEIQNLCWESLTHPK
ncbi:hypothetical protein [Streptomyces sp. ITFR-16]|uniref:hypothetical protein n=1 Tax=Streptomyces sp. ITFR-16 TaxID=3075198 RepID=UPI00288A5F55|nr:hypothetical protein [Streptomyces sp. ITFR-16]WNI27159.1 hypothetical protein RLT58_35010 [Streptomyces sp. ITFR-16]